MRKLVCVTQLLQFLSQANGEYNWETRLHILCNRILAMPVTVFPHSDFESLIGTWEDGRFWSRPDPVPVVIPSLSFSDQFQRQIADRRGVCMGFEFLTPQDFIHRAVGPGPESPWTKERLLWRILPRLEDPIEGLPRVDSQREGFALAGLLADRFDQYGHFRPDLIRLWARGKSAGLDHEHWQQALWTNMRRDIAIPHPAEELERLRTDPDFRTQLKEAFPQLTVLANGTIDPLLTEVLLLLSEAGGEVTTHIVLPSLGFLADLRQHDRLPQSDGSPEEIALDGSNPLLVSLGRNAVGAFALLGELDESYAHWPEGGTAGDGAGSLLGQIQADIRALRAPTPMRSDPSDSSLRVHSCFGRRRELEVLRDELLRAFQELPDLRPEEIHIVAPGLENYAPWVSTIFNTGDPLLPVHLTEDLSPQGNALAEGILAILDMVQRGRFEISEVLDLLEKQGVRRALDCEDVEGIRHWVCASGMTRGLGADTLGGWTAARERLVAGKWFGPDSSAQYPCGQAAGQWVLPVADPVCVDAALRDRLLDWLAALEATCAEWRSPATPADWVGRFRRICPDLVSSENPGSLLTQYALLEDTDTPTRIEAGCIADWLRESVRESRRRRRLSGGISFGRLRHLQNLPCRVLAIVGMDNFPAVDHSPAWDLLRHRPRIWDRSPRTDDRQLFLDALLAPTDRLIITAANRNVRSRKVAPLASCVDELLRVIQSMGAGRPVLAHRLQPFSRDYYAGLDLPRSFNADGLEIALAIQANRTPLPFFEGGTDPPLSGHPAPAQETLSQQQLAKFWKNPARAFVKAQGIALPAEVSTDEQLNRLPLALDGRTGWVVRDEIRKAMSDDPASLEFLKARLTVRRQLPPASQGDVNWRESRQSIEALSRRIAEIAGKETTWNVPIRGTMLTATASLSKDGLQLVGFHINTIKGETVPLRHALGSWLASLIAAASGSSLQTRFLYPSGSEIVEVTLAAPSQGVSVPILESLVEGFSCGQTMPLPFGLQTSEAIARALPDQGMALQRGREAWEKRDGFGGGPGEGLCPEALLAWRDRDPFAEPFLDQWFHWTRVLTVPLQEWLP